MRLNLKILAIFLIGLFSFQPLSVSADNSTETVQIMSLGGVEAVGNTYWALYVNGTMSMVGAHDVILSEDTFIRLNMEAF